LELLDLERGIRTPIGPDATPPLGAAWSPDGEQIAFVTWVEGDGQLAVARARDGGERVVLTNARGMGSYLGSFTPDGRQFLFSRHSDLDKQGDLLLVDVAGRAPPQPFLSGPTSDRSPRLSPDGTWAAFVRAPRGSEVKGELMVTGFPTAEGRWQVTGSGVAFHDWFPSFGWLAERELFWLDAETRVVLAAAFSPSGGALGLGAPRPLLGGLPLGGDTLRFELFPGLPNSPLLLALVDLSGTPTFFILSFGQFDDDCRWELAGTVPPGLEGLVATFLGFGTTPTGHFLASDPAVVAFE
jgi:dipeptidyl aminopeptidase/acylaminoacyl peptidase